LKPQVAPAAPDRPIGVFDSGVGGLSVLRALQQELPDERFVYISDSGHGPYGERDDAHLLHRSLALTRYLVMEHQAKGLVVACNTATAAAIARLRSDHPQLPIVGIEPALKPAAAASRTGVVGVMATRATLQSEKFAGLLQSLQGEATFVLQACDGLADAIERADHARTADLCQRYLDAMGKFGNTVGSIDTLVLGCTHYVFATDMLGALCGPGIGLLEAGAPVASQTRRVLRGLLRPAQTANRPTQPALFFTTGVETALQRAVQRWMHTDASVQGIDVR
jgi:glutamate racemase